MKLTREQLAKIIKEEDLRLNESVLDIAKKRRRMLQKGDKGRDVVELQMILSKLGSTVADVLSRQGKLAKGGVDGDYGQATYDAVEQFQLLDGQLDVDGKVGPMTARALLELPLEGEPKAKDKPKVKEPARPAKPKKKVAAHVAVKKVHPLITTDRRDIASLHPDLSRKVQSIIADLKAQGFTGDMEPVFGPIGGFRTAATQDKIFSSGKGLTFVRFSKHNNAEYDEGIGQVLPASLAADIMPKIMYDAVKPDPETGESRLTGDIPKDKYPEAAKFLAALGKLARKNGLRWLGSPRSAKTLSPGFKKYDYRTGKRLKPKDYASKGFRFDAVHVELPVSARKAKANTLAAMTRTPADLKADAAEMMATLDPKFQPDAADAGTIAENLVTQRVLEKLLDAPQVVIEGIRSLAGGRKALLLGKLKGKYSEDVEEVQSSLSLLGYDIGADGADGYYGNSTVTAVKAFLNDIDPDGQAVAKRFQTGKAIGPRTAAMILKQLEDKGLTPPAAAKKPARRATKKDFGSSDESPVRQILFSGDPDKRRELYDALGAADKLTVDAVLDKRKVDQEKYLSGRGPNLRKKHSIQRVDAIAFVEPDYEAVPGIVTGHGGVVILRGSPRKGTQLGTVYEFGRYIQTKQMPKVRKWLKSKGVDASAISDDELKTRLGSASAEEGVEIGGMKITKSMVKTFFSKGFIGTARGYSVKFPAIKYDENGTPTNAKSILSSLVGQIKGAEKPYQGAFIKGVNREAASAYAKARVGKIQNYDLSGTSGENCGTFMVNVLRAGGGAGNDATANVDQGDFRAAFGYNKTPNTLLPKLVDDSDEALISV